MKNRAEGIRNLLGITKEQVSSLLGVTPHDLAMHEIGERKLPMEKGYSLENLYRVAKFASEDNNTFYITASQIEKYTYILELLQHNEEQQKVLIPKIRVAEVSHQQQFARYKLFESSLDYRNQSEDSWSKKIKDTFGEVSKPDFVNELYMNQIKLNTLKYERRLLEKELQGVIDKT